MHIASGFVDGTLIHTEKGLMPIEKVQVGDLVYSCNEITQGSTSLNKVNNVFKYPEREVWYVPFQILDTNSKVEGEFSSEYKIHDRTFKTTKKRFFFVAGGYQPVYVQGYINTYGSLVDLSVWENVRDLGFDYIHDLGREEYVIDSRGTLTICNNNNYALIDSISVAGIVKNSNFRDYGIVACKGPFIEEDGTYALSFSNGKPELTKSFGVDLDEQIDHSRYVEGSIGFINFGFPPLLRDVYNLEVENAHNYFVTEVGVLVSDVTQIKI